MLENPVLGTRLLISLITTHREFFMTYDRGVASLVVFKRIYLLLYPPNVVSEELHVSIGYQKKTLADFGAGGVFGDAVRHPTAMTARMAWLAG